MSGPIYGFHPVREALRGRPQEAIEVLIARGRAGSRREEIERLCRAAGVPVRVVSDDQLHAASGGVDNGFLLRVRQGEPRRSGGDPGMRVLLEDVQDPRNLGAILRVWEGSGVGEVMIRDRGIGTPVGGGGQGLRGGQRVADAQPGNQFREHHCPAQERGLLDLRARGGRRAALAG